jgi:hypothetical protein
MNGVGEHVDFTLFLDGLLGLLDLRDLIDARLSDLLEPERCETVKHILNLGSCIHHVLRLHGLLFLKPSQILMVSVHLFELHGFYLLIKHLGRGDSRSVGRGLHCSFHHGLEYLLNKCGLLNVRSAIAHVVGVTIHGRQGHFLHGDTGNIQIHRLQGHLLVNEEDLQGDLEHET